MIEDSSLRIVAVELLRKFNFDLVPGQEMHGIPWEGDQEAPGWLGLGDYTLQLYRDYDKS